MRLNVKEQKDQELCYSCKKHFVKNSFTLCKSCNDDHRKWEIKQQQDAMRGTKSIRLLRCEKCGGTSFRFIWSYDKKNEFNMIWCHDGIGFELDGADKICTNCGNKGDPNVELIDDIFGEWINKIEGTSD